MSHLDLLSAKNHSTRHGIKPPSFESLWDSSGGRYTAERTVDGSPHSGGQNYILDFSTLPTSRRHLTARIALSGGQSYPFVYIDVDAVYNGGIDVVSGPTLLMDHEITIRGSL